VQCSPAAIGDAQALCDGADAAERGVDHLEKSAALGSELHLSDLSQEQRLAQPMLERANPMADRRRCD
jgi:hypothetical protein